VVGLRVIESPGVAHHSETCILAWNTEVEDATEASPEDSSGKPAVPRSGFPAYLLFDPETTVSTSGSAALSGAALPSGAAGLIVRLNRDSARHFDNRTGTANLSVPVATLSTIRFGVFAGKYQRARAEFGLRIRYLTSDAAIEVQEVATNIMAYGFAPGESGHGDIRLLMPAVLRTLGESISAEGAPVPTEGDFALLEWPTPASPVFRLTYLDSRSPMFEQARGIFEKAEASDQLVGDGACWLMANSAPAW